MKMKTSLYAAAVVVAAAALASCSGNSEGDSMIRQLSDYKDLTAGDSVAYYYGQLTSLEYWRNAKVDTTLLDRESRDQYLKGLRAGYDAIRSNDAYNQGFFMGVQLAMQMKEFGEDYSTTVSKKVLVNAIEDGLKQDSIINEGELQQNFTEITNSIQMRKDAADRAEAAEILKKEAARNKWQAINVDLYAGPARGGEGDVLKEGDQVGISVVFMNPKGQPIDRRENPDMIVGKMLPGAVTQGLQTMKVGQTRTFYASAQAVFGRFCQRYGLKGNEIVSFRMTTMPPKAQSVAEDEAGN